MNRLAATALTAVFAFAIGCVSGSAQALPYRGLFILGAFEAPGILTGGGDLMAASKAVNAEYAANIESMIFALKNAGGRELLIAKVPDIGLAPAVGSILEDAGLATFLASTMNVPLEPTPSGLPDFGAHVHMLSLFGLVQAAVADKPGNFGLIDVISACALSGACIADPPTTYGIDPSVDQMPPAHQAQLLIPEPGTLSLAIVAVLALAAALRRRVRTARVFNRGA